MTVTIRRACEADVPAVYALDRGCSPVYADPDGYRRLLDVGGLLAVAGRAGILHGFAAFSCVLDEATLLNIAVDPGARRAGTGVALLRWCRDSLAAAGIQRVLLEVRDSNTAAQRLYVGAGFRAGARRRGYYAARDDLPREDALLMTLDIGRSGSVVS